MNGTPLTDAAVTKLAQRQDSDIVEADFTRALERENRVFREALERIATETQGLRLRYRHQGELSPPLIEEFARAALKQSTK